MSVPGRRGRAAKAPMKTGRSRPLFLACSVAVVAIIALGIASSASAQEATTSAHSSPSPPPPPFDPAVGWPSSGVRTLDVTLPPAETVEDEEYLCTSVPLPQGVPLGLTRVEPLASAAVVHHILLFGGSGGVSWAREQREGALGKRREIFQGERRCRRRRDVRPFFLFSL